MDKIQHNRRKIGVWGMSTLFISSQIKEAFKMLISTTKKQQLQSIAKQIIVKDGQQFVYALIKNGHTIKNRILIRKEFLSEKS